MGIHDRNLAAYIVGEDQCVSSTEHVSSGDVQSDLACSLRLVEEMYVGMIKQQPEPA